MKEFTEISKIRAFFLRIIFHLSVFSSLIIMKILGENLQSNLLLGPSWLRCYDTAQLSLVFYYLALSRALSNIHIDFRPNTPCSLAWLVEGRITLGGGSLWYRNRTDYGTVWTVWLGATGVHAHIPCPASCPADLQL